MSLSFPDVSDELTFSDVLIAQIAHGDAPEIVDDGRYRVGTEDLGYPELTDLLHVALELFTHVEELHPDVQEAVATVADFAGRVVIDADMHVGEMSPRQQAEFAAFREYAPLLHKTPA